MNIRDIGAACLKKALDAYGVPNSAEGVRANIDLWASNKADLIGQLSAHPLWREDDLSIVTTITEERVTARENIARVFDQLMAEIGACGGDDKLKAGAQLYNIWCSERITQDALDSAQRASIEPLPVVGMKTSRYLRKWITENGIDADGTAERRRLMTQYAESVNPYRTERTLVLSVNPADYALMSNGSSWSSCHNVARHSMHGADEQWERHPGEYQAGCFSYMNDGVTLVAYTLVPSDGWNAVPLCLRPKNTRQLFYVHPDGQLFIQSRPYPHQSAETQRNVRAFVHSVLSDVCGFENKWAAPRRGAGENIVSQDSYLHYPDYHAFSESTRLSYTKSVEQDVLNGEYNSSFGIGQDALCLLCGNDYMEHSGSLYCCQHEERDEYD